MEEFEIYSQFKTSPSSMLNEKLNFASNCTYDLIKQLSEPFKNQERADS